jgi:gliding motility-associated-like protein
LLSHNRFFKYLLCLFVILFIHKQAMPQNYIFAQMNGTPLNTAGWNLQGDARIADIIDSENSELLLCHAIVGLSGAAFFNQPINLSMCNRWKAAFDFRMFDGTGADGLAFCFLDVPPSGFVTGGGLGIPNTANGLKVCFDTWNNCIDYDASTVHQDMPKIEIRWGTGYNDNSNPNLPIMGECLNQPTRDNSDGKIGFIRSSNYNHAMITYDSGNIQVFVNGTLYLTGFQQFNFVGYLGFTASTGGYTDNHSIKNVVIYTEMPPSFAGNSISFCPYDTVQLGGAPNPSYAYSWYPSTGLNDTSVSSPLLHIPNDSSNSQLHKYYVKTSFSSKPGCASIDSVIVNVYPNPKVHFITPEICLKDAIAQFYDSSFTTDNTTLPFSYQWSFGDPNAQAGNPNTSTVQNAAHHYSAASNYQVGLLVTNSKGCTDSASKIFTVNGAVPKAGFSVNNASGLCSNQSVVITNQSGVDFGSITKVQLFWGDTSTVSYTDSAPYPGKQYSHNYPNPVTTNAINYTIRMISSSGITCENETDQQINIQPSPHVQFDSIPFVCDNSPTIQITEASEITSLQGSFVFSGKGISAEGVFDPKQAGAGTDSLLYTYTASNECTDSAYQTIYVQASPVVNAGPDLSVLLGDNVIIDATATGTALQYLWSPATYLNNDTTLQPVSTPPDDITYMIKVTGVGNCSNSSQVFIKVLFPPVIPNAFSPNGDGINDYWNIKYLDSYPNCDVSVFNRYGQLVFHSVGYTKSWDGTYNGNQLPVGTYYYLIDTKRQKKLYSGSLLLIR